MRISGLPETRAPEGIGHEQRATTTLLLLDAGHPSRLIGRPNRRRDRLLARALSTRLDRQLAEGRTPESRRLLAVRAQYLVRPTTRLDVARAWQNLAARSGVAPTGRSARVPLRRTGIAACEPEIRELAGALMRPVPCAAAGVAEASRLLTDGTGPVFQYRHPEELRAALRGAIARLDPGLPL